MDSRGSTDRTAGEDRVVLNSGLRPVHAGNRRARDPPSDVEPMRECLRELLPDLDGPCCTPRPVSTRIRLTIISWSGFIPSWGPRRLAAGFSGHGFKFLQRDGRDLSGPGPHGKSNHDLSLFNLDRFKR